MDDASGLLAKAQSSRHKAQKRPSPSSFPNGVWERGRLWERGLSSSRLVSGTLHFGVDRFLGESKVARVYHFSTVPRDQSGKIADVDALWQEVHRAVHKQGVHAIGVEAVELAGAVG